MIELNGYKIGIEFEGFKLESYDQFYEFEMYEEAGGMIPTLFLKLRVNSYEDIKDLKIGLGIKITFGTKNIKEYIFRVTEYRIYKNDGLILELKGIYFYKEFLDLTRIQYFDKKASEIIKGLTSIIPNINFDTTESMIWIQCNQTDKEFIEDVIKHTYLFDSYPIFGYNIQGEIVVKDAKETFNNPILNFRNTSDIRYDSFELSSNGYLTNFLSEERVLPVLQINNRELTNYYADRKALNDKFYTKSTNTKSYGTKIDCKNVYNNYFQAEITNLSKWVRLEQNILNVHFEKTTPDIDKFTLCDGITFYSDDYFIDNVKGINGVYFVKSKRYYFNQKKFTLDVELVRDYVLD